VAAKAKPFGGRKNKPRRGPRLGATGVVGPKGEVTFLAGAARTTAQNSPDANIKAGSGLRGLLLFVNVTAGTFGSITVTIQGKDPITGTYYNVLVSAAIVATGFTVLRVYPGLVAAANLTASDVLPDTIRVTVAVGNANSITYSVTGQFVP
jgi:hypothetical protein